LVRKPILEDRSKQALNLFTGVQVCSQCAFTNQKGLPGGKRRKSLREEKPSLLLAMITGEKVVVGSLEKLKEDRILAK